MTGWIIISAKDFSQTFAHKDDAVNTPLLIQNLYYFKTTRQFHMEFFSSVQKSLVHRLASYHIYNLRYWSDILYVCRKSSTYDEVMFLDIFFWIQRNCKIYLNVSVLFYHITVTEYLKEYQNELPLLGFLKQLSFVLEFFVCSLEKRFFLSWM